MRHAFNCTCPCLTVTHTLQLLEHMSSASMHADEHADEQLHDTIWASSGHRARASHAGQHEKRLMLLWVLLLQCSCSCPLLPTLPSLLGSFAINGAIGLPAISYSNYPVRPVVSALHVPSFFMRHAHSQLAACLPCFSCQMHSKACLAATWHAAASGLSCLVGRASAKSSW